MNQICTNEYKYDYKKTIKEHFMEMGKEMFELKPNTKLELTENESQEIEEEEKILFKNKIVQKNEFKYEGENELQLRKFIIDELGSSTFVKNGFNPEYDCF